MARRRVFKPNWGSLILPVCIGIVAAMLPATLVAQVDTGTITGIVQDEMGAVIPGATVVVTNVGTNEKVELLTNDTGFYRVSPLLIGQYQVSASLAGFKTEIRTGITLNVQQVARIDFTLQVGQITEEVLVSGEAPQLESETTSLGQIVEQKSVTDLPLNGRNYLQLVKLSAGVLDPPRGDRATEGGSFTANGVRATLNNFILDGVDNNSKIVDIQNSSNVVVQPSVDAIQEFRVQTHNFSAEFGHSAGAVVNATIKSGTNKFHGTGFWFLRDDALDARDFFSPSDQEKPALSRDQFGGTVGGPIMQDKFFFFGSWEATRLTRGKTLVRTLPSAAMKQGDFSGRNPLFDPFSVRENPDGDGFIRDPVPGNIIPTDSIDPLAAKVIALIPDPTDPSSEFNNFVSSPPQEDTRDQFDFRLDYILGDNDRFFGRYSLMEREFINPGPFEPPLVGTSFFQDAKKDQRGQGFAFGQTHTFNPVTINEARVGYNRIRDGLNPFVTDFTPTDFGFIGIPPEPDITGLPRMTVSGYATFGEALFLPNFKISETSQFNDNFSVIKGNHSLKAGFNFRYVRSWFWVSGQARGFFNFNGTFTQDPLSRSGTGDAFADFMLGAPNSTQVSTIFAGDIRYQYWGLYLQDDWKVNPRLTVNLGVRYELLTPSVERTNLQGNFDVDQLKVVFPNNEIPEGIPASLAGTIPAGVHDRGLIATDKNNIAPRLGLAYMLSDKTVLRVGAGVFYADHLAVGASGRLVASPPFRVNANFPTDETFLLNTLSGGFPAEALSVREVSASTSWRGWSMDMPVAYTYHWNLNLQQELPMFLLDVGYTGTKGTQLPMGVNWNQQGPGPGSVASRRPIQGFGSISGQTPGNNAIYNALLIRAERRFRNGWSFLTSYTWSHAIDYGGEQLVSDSNYRDFLNHRVWARANTLFDVRHRVSFNSIWDLPIGSGQKVDLGNSFANAVIGNWQLAGIVTLQGGKPFTPNLGFSTARTGHNRPDRLRDGNLSGDQRSIANWFDTSAFAPADASIYEFGDAGKNILRGPGFANLDFSLFKVIPFPQLGEQGQVQIRIESFNFTNTPHFDLPNTRVDLPQGGVISSLAGNMREFQIGFKVLF